MAAKHLFVWESPLRFGVEESIHPAWSGCNLSCSSACKEGFKCSCVPMRVSWWMSVLHLSPHGNCWCCLPLKASSWTWSPLESSWCPYLGHTDFADTVAEFLQLIVSRGLTQSSATWLPAFQPWMSCSSICDSLFCGWFVLCAGWIGLGTYLSTTWFSPWCVLGVLLTCFGCATFPVCVICHMSVLQQISQVNSWE